MLDLFREYEVRATWATVGMLFFETKRELLDQLPERQPSYRDPRLSSYRDLDAIGEGEKDDPYHYAPTLVRAIVDAEHHEIGTHTFSHYFCLEEGADTGSFDDDLAAVKRAARPYGVTPRSLVFPGNQVGEEYLRSAERAGFDVYRGTESAWLYRPTARGEHTTVRRGLRLLDAYVALTSHNSYQPDELVLGSMTNVPSSRFLRPYVPALGRLEVLRAWRITSDLEHAARHDLVYHLWWHPHNFGISLDENLAMLRGVLRRFATLRERYGLRSVTMADLADELRSGAR
jgi:hypothetical protein